MHCKLYNAIKDRIKDFAYDVNNNSEDNINSMIKNELYSEYGYDDKGYITWKTPDKNYIFKVSREDAIYNIKAGYKYIISIDIYSAVSSLICKIKLSELQMVDLLYNISSLFNFGGGYIHTLNNKLSCIYHINGNICNNEMYIFNIERLNIDYILKDDDRINFIISSSVNNVIEPLVTMNMTYIDLRELCFHLFFYTLIDIDLPVDEYIMNEIEGFISY